MRSLTSRLTPDQKRLLLVLCDRMDAEMARGNYTRPACAMTLRNRPAGNFQPNAIRENTTADALVRKGLAKELPSHGARLYLATDAGYELGDGLRIEDRLGKIPPRRGGK